MFPQYLIIKNKNVITDEEIISYVRPTTESESEDESSIVKRKITTEEVLKSLETVLSYIQDPPENLYFWIFLIQ